MELFKTLEVMNAEKMKSEINALKLHYNITIDGQKTKHRLDLDTIMEKTVVHMTMLYNTGKIHSKEFNWKNGSSMSIEKLQNLKNDLHVPNTAEISLNSTFNVRDDDVIISTEFVWFIPYVDFNDFYMANKTKFNQLLSNAQQNHQLAANFMVILDRRK